MNTMMITIPVLSVMAAAAVFGCMSTAGGAPEGAGKGTAFLLVDIQNDYFPGGQCEMLGADKAAETAKRLLVYFRTTGARIIHIRHENTGPGPSFFIPGTPGAEIHPLVAPLKGETVILKHRPSSFIGTALEAELRKDGIGRLVICGMQSNVCVISTALDAVEKNFPVTVVADAIAAKDRTVHEKAVEEMKARGVSIVFSKMLLRQR